MQLVHRHARPLVHRHARPLLHRHARRLGRDGDGDDLLSENVERVAGNDRGLDQPFVHAAGDDRALEQIAAELGEDPTLAHLADAMARAADALQAAGDGLGRLDLQDQVHGAHVYPQLERARGHQAGQLAGLQEVLDLYALLAGERTVVRARELRRRRPLGPSAILLRGQLVQSQRHALGGAAVVDEHDRRVVLAHQPQQLRVDRRPDRALSRRHSRVSRHHGRVGCRPGGVSRETGFGHGLDRDLDAQVEPPAGDRPAAPASTIVHVRRAPTRKRPISSSGALGGARPIR